MSSSQRVKVFLLELRVQYYFQMVRGRVRVKFIVNFLNEGKG